MDYATPDRRKSKNDKRAKSRFNRYKKGGQNRTNNIDLSQNKPGQK